MCVSITCFVYRRIVSITRDENNVEGQIKDKVTEYKTNIYHLHCNMCKDTLNLEDNSSEDQLLLFKAIQF